MEHGDNVGDPEDQSNGNGNEIQLGGSRNQRNPLDPSWVEKNRFRPAPLNPLDIEAAPTDFPIDVNPTTTEEIRMAIRQIKNWKATQPGNIQAEARKSDIKVTASMLHVLFKKIWEEEQVPTNWKEEYFTKIPKKDLSECENYSRIKLLSVPGKVFNRVFLNWMKDSIDSQLRYTPTNADKDSQCSSSLCISKPQHTERKKQDPQIQHKEHRPKHT
ncbi:unnamed protein product [Schistosoma curassoni]|uniref:Reverse transcriptase domain-containing protein n=1 Tax=Schistosoma curassoni TaxID=6186 RepID=A0A183K663_9TREM|nr:unnamed protein product [Schistosoma curassoni]